MRFADYLSDEIARLEAELEALPTYQLLKALKAAAAVAPAVYGPPAPIREQLPPAPSPHNLDEGEPKRAASGRRLNPARQQALDAVVTKLTGHPEPIKTANLYEYVMGLGIELGGSDPQNNLSALLYHSGLFTSHGRRGWTLKQEGDGAVEQEEEEESDEEETAPESRNEETEASEPEPPSDQHAEQQPRLGYPWESAPP